MAVGINDINNYHNMTDVSDETYDNNDSPSVGSNNTSGLSNSNRMEFHQLHGYPTGHLLAREGLLSNLRTLPAAVFSQGSVVPQNLLVPNGISKITELTLDQFQNNFTLC